MTHLFSVKNLTSDLWAKKLLLEHIGTEKVSCINKEETALNDEKVLARVVVLNPSTGFTYNGRISSENQWEVFEQEYNNPSLSLIVPAGMQYEADNGDFMYQYIAMVNLALKHTTIEDLQGVISDLEDLKSEAMVDLITMWETVSEWNLLPIGHVQEISKDKMSFIAYDSVDYGSKKIDFAGDVIEEGGYIYNQESSFNIDLKTKKAQFKIELLPTDKDSENYLKQNKDIGQQVLDFDCEYSVKQMSFF